jgi:two-component system LytT family response regulator
LRETISTLETRLDPKHFVRVHRSTMVNIDRIQELQPSTHGDFIVLLKDGTKLRMSRRYRENLAGIWG